MITPNIVKVQIVDPNGSKLRYAALKDLFIKHHPFLKDAVPAFWPYVFYNRTELKPQEQRQNEVHNLYRIWHDGYSYGEALNTLHGGLDFPEKERIKRHKEAIEMANEDINKLQSENRDLKRLLDKLKDALETFLVSLDWTIKIGSVAALYFFPVVQNKIAQSLGLLIFILLVTAVSKAITRVKSIQTSKELF